MSQQHITGHIIITGVLLSLLLGQSAYAAQTLYVNNTQVNLRSSPTAAKNNILAAIPKNTEVSVLSQQGVWYNVRLPDGREGWMSGLLLISRESTSQSRGIDILGEGRQTNTPKPPDVSGKMVFIPGGAAIIGSDEQELDSVLRTWNGVSRDTLMDESPKQTVPIQGFSIDQYEVTNAQYKQFVDAEQYPVPPHWVNGTYPEGTENHPVTYVLWDDAQAYAQWAGKRLPSADEWELAARGVQGQIFPWGTTFEPQDANVAQPQTGTAAVGSYPQDKSPYNVYDMGGNVMEWTATNYGENKDFFILKGSSWSGKPFEARGANQSPGEGLYQLPNIGFRCVKSGAAK